MPARDRLPAPGLTLSVALAIDCGRLRTGGDGPVPVRLDEAGIRRLFTDPSLHDAALPERPAPGLAVLRGDKGRIRSSLALALAWSGRTPCTPSP